MKSVLIVAGVVIALIGGAVMLGRSSDEQSSIDPNQGAVKVSVHELTISGFSYQPGSIDVDLGETVTLKITNRDRVHHHFIILHLHFCISHHLPIIHSLTFFYHLAI